MKVLVPLLCALGLAAGGSVSWPGAITLTAPLIKTILPSAHTKTTAYSTSQYINALPASYSFAHPQFAYQVPLVPSVASFQHQYYPTIASHSYLPTNFYYPSSISPVFGSSIPQVPFIPSFPSSPVPTAPNFPENSQNTPTSQPPGDIDSAVVDSADYVPENSKQQEPTVSPTPSQPPATEENVQSTQPGISQFPSFNPLPSLPQIPQIPQGSGQIPSLPQFPQNPNLPQLPQFPPNIVFPQGPSQPSDYPGGNNEDRGLNDEDSVSVESA